MLAEQRLESDVNYGNWDSMIKYFEKFAPSISVSMRLTENLCLPLSIIWIK